MTSSKNTTDSKLNKSNQELLLSDKQEYKLLRQHVQQALPKSKMFDITTRVTIGNYIALTQYIRDKDIILCMRKTKDNKLFFDLDKGLKRDYIFFYKTNNIAMLQGRSFPTLLSIKAGLTTDNNRDCPICFLKTTFPIACPNCIYAICTSCFDRVQGTCPFCRKQQIK